MPGRPYPGAKERRERGPVVREPRMVECRGRCGGSAPVLDAICAACLAAVPADLLTAYDLSRLGPANLTRRFAAEDAIVAWLVRGRLGLDDWPEVV